MCQVFLNVKSQGVGFEMRGCLQEIFLMKPALFLLDFGQASIQFKQQQQNNSFVYMQISQIKPEDKNLPEKIGGLQLRGISWKDFKGKNHLNLPYSAHIYWIIEYEIFPHPKKKKSIVKVDVKILPRSWAIEQNRNSHLLMHEYGHYLIGCICALAFQKKINIEMKQPVNNTPEWIKSVFKETLDEYLKLQKFYDEETNHRLDFKKQQQWEECLIKTLQQYKVMQEKSKSKDFKIHKCKVKHK